MSTLAKIDVAGCCVVLALFTWIVAKHIAADDWWPVLFFLEIQALIVLHIRERLSERRR